MLKNNLSLDTLCASLSYAMGIEKPETSQPSAEILTNYIDEAFQGEKADRVFMYNPDAITQ